MATLAAELVKSVRKARRCRGVAVVPVHCGQTSGDDRFLGTSTDRGRTLLRCLVLRKNNDHRAMSQVVSVLDLIRRRTATAGT